MRSTRGHGRRKILMDSHPYGYETRTFTSRSEKKEQTERVSIVPLRHSVTVTYFNFAGMNFLVNPIFDNFAVF